MSNKTNSNPIEKRECICCGGDIKIRNPKGYCDHLYYPENCNGKCTPPVESWEKELEQILIEWEGKDNAILGAVRVLSRTKRLKQFISSQIQQSEARLVEKIKKEYNKRYQKIAKEHGLKRKTPHTMFHDVLATLKEEK